MIGQIVCICINKKKLKRKVVREYRKGKKRFYELIDLDTRIKHKAFADLFDEMFKTVKTKFVRNRHTKGKAIIRKQLITA